MKALIVFVGCSLILLMSEAYKVEVTGANERVVESGVLKDFGLKDGPVLIKEGEFAYKDPQSKFVQEKWVADEKGFKAQGNRLPTPPPIPQAIQDSLVKNRVKPPFGPGSN